MTPEEFDILVKAKRSEGVDYCAALIQAFDAVIAHATRQREAAAEMKRAIEAVRPNPADDEDDY